MRAVIEVSGVRKAYGKTVAVEEASFEVYEGEIFGLIGPNGAGKTTTMECIEGLRKPDRGTIAVLGLDPYRQVYKLQNRIGVQLQQAQLQKRIKVWEAVDLWASLYQKKSVDAAHLLEQLGLTDKRNAWFMNLSGGQKQRLFIALALINDPEVVFLDELTTGLDPQARHVFDNPFDGRGGAAVRPRGHHGTRADYRYRHAGEPGAAALPGANGCAGYGCCGCGGAVREDCGD
jgi:ABC-2 type transport system ATP-binding protein